MPVETLRPRAEPRPCLALPQTLSSSLSPSLDSASPATRLVPPKAVGLGAVRHPPTPQAAAYLYEHKVRCGRAACRCATTAFRHRMWCVSFTEDGRSRTRVVPEEQWAQIHDMTQAYRRFRGARSQLKRLCDQLMAAVDAFGERQCGQGKASYERLRARRRPKAARRSSSDPNAEQP